MSKNIATRESYGKALKRMGELNKDIVVLDADLSKSTKTAVFKEAHPERHFNMGIAEQNMVGVAAGLAAVGKIPVASSFAMFAAGRAFEIIRNSVCYPKLNVKICATHAGVTVGDDGASHQAIEDLSLMRSLPNMVVLNPGDDVTAQKAVEAMIAYEGPVYARFGRAAVPVVHSDDVPFEIGKGIEMYTGTDVTIIATGILVAEAVEAREILEKEGYSVRLIDMHTIKPIDVDAIVKAATETKAIVTAEEHSIIGGLGSAVAEVVAENAPVKVVRVGVKDTFGESGKPDQLMEAYGLRAKNIVKAVKSALGETVSVEAVK